MVECEWDLSGKKAAYIAVLIDTWWNVNKGSDLDQYGDNEF